MPLHISFSFRNHHSTVNREILLAKLQHYGVRGFPLNWFKSYLEDRTQYTEVNSTSSRILQIKNGVPQGSALGPLLFLIYINDLHNVVPYSDIYHFTDVTNLLYSSKSLKDINKKVNFELKNIVHWLRLRANRISLNTSKTDLILFRSKRKQITKHLNFRISGQKIKIACKTKYLGLLLDENLNFKSHIDSLKTKLRRANCLLSKIRHYVRKDLLRTIYYALFDSHLRYGCQIWGQCQTQSLHNLEVLQNKALRILKFTGHRENSQPLYKISKIFKLKDLVRPYNLQLVQNHLNDFLPDNFLNYFTKTTNLHEHDTRGIRLNVPIANTTCCSSNSITFKSIRK